MTYDDVVLVFLWCDFDDHTPPVGTTWGQDDVNVESVIHEAAHAAALGFRVFTHETPMRVAKAIEGLPASAQRWHETLALSASRVLLRRLGFCRVDTHLAEEAALQGVPYRRDHGDAFVVAEKAAALLAAAKVACECESED